MKIYLFLLPLCVVFGIGIGYIFGTSGDTFSPIKKNQKNITLQKDNMGEKTTMSITGNNKVDNEAIVLKDMPVNAVESMLGIFFDINSKQQLESLASRQELNGYILLVQKILNEKKKFGNYSIDDIALQLDLVLEKLYQSYASSEDTVDDFSDFQSPQDFIVFMKEKGLKGKVLGEDFDISEIIAGNYAYCDTSSTFMSEVDKKWCKAQIDFFTSSSLEDIKTIDAKLFPEWKRMAEDYYSKSL